MRLIRHVTSAGLAYAALQPDGSAREITGDPLAGTHQITDLAVTLGKRLAPVPGAPLIIGIRLNYAKHAAEGGKALPDRPMWFVKLPGSLQNPGDPIILPRNQPTTKADYEAELAIVLGRECRDATRENALSYVLGYTCANDVSARDWQRDLAAASFAMPRASTPSVRSAPSSSRPTNFRIPTSSASVRFSTARSCRTRPPPT